jgi:hypothetical protein
MTVALGMAIACAPAKQPDAMDGAVIDPAHDGCPPDLPLVSDWGEGLPLRVVAAGTTVDLNFSPVTFEKRCVVVDTAGPGGPFPVTVSAPQVEFLAASAGTYSVTIHHWTRVGRSYALSVAAQDPPATLQPCALLPRSCARVFDAQAHVTCDDTLYSLAGDPLRTLDGGAWFGSGDALFAWEAELLRRISITDGGVEEVASSASLRPHLWAFGGGRLAIGTGDVGAGADADR